MWIQGDLYDHESLVKALKQVDIVISTVGAPQTVDQVKIIAAIKEAGNIKVIIVIINQSCFCSVFRYFRNCPEALNSKVDFGVFGRLVMEGCFKLVK